MPINRQWHRSAPPLERLHHAKRGSEPARNGRHMTRCAGSTVQNFRIMGVAGDVRAEGLTKAATQIAYFPIVPNQRGVRWIPPQRMTIAVRTTRPDPVALLPETRRVLSSIDAEVPLANARTAREIVDRSLARVSFVMTLLGIAATMALLLGRSACTEPSRTSSGNVEPRSASAWRSVRVWLRSEDWSFGRHSASQWPASQSGSLPPSA